MHNFSRKILAFGFALAAATSAHATLVDFNDFGSDSGAPRSVIEDKGLTFTGTNLNVYGQNIYGFFNSNGTPWLITNNHFITTITATSGEDFSLTKLDLELASVLDLTSQDYATLVGHLSNGTTVSTDVLISAASYTTFYLSGFENLRSVDVSKRELGNGSIGIDNLEFSAQAVPEPASLSLLGLGLLGLAASRRKRQK